MKDHIAREQINQIKEDLARVKDILKISSGLLGLQSETIEEIKRELNIDVNDSLFPL